MKNCSPEVISILESKTTTDAEAEGKSFRLSVIVSGPSPDEASSVKVKAKLFDDPDTTKLPFRLPLDKSAELIPVIV